MNDSPSLTTLPTEIRRILTANADESLTRHRRTHSGTCAWCEREWRDDSLFPCWFARVALAIRTACHPSPQ